MRFSVLLLSAIAATSTDAYGIFVSVNDAGIDQTPEFTLGPGPRSRLRLDLNLANSSTNSVQLSAAQVALSIRPLPDATVDSGVVLELVTGVDSLFGVPAIDGASNVEGVTTPQAADLFSSVALAPMSRLPLAAIDAHLAPGAKGSFQLVALGFAPGSTQTSSEWRAPAMPPVFPMPMPFEAGQPAPGGGTLLAVFTVVPEPGCALLVAPGLVFILLTRPRLAGTRPSSCR